MAVKYRLSFSNINLEQVVVEISHPDYVGDVTSVIGVGGESYSLSRSAIDTPHASHVVPTTANINLYTNLIDVEELQQANDKEWRVNVTVSGNIDFDGYLVPDGIQKTLKGAGNIVRISATCGLALLHGVNYSWYGANFGLVNVDGLDSVNLCPMNFIRQILYLPNYIGSQLPITWYTSIKYDTAPTRDFFAGSMPFSSLTGLSELFQFNDVDAYWILENMVKSGKCTIVQQSGKWHIINYEDLINANGLLNTLEIPAQMSSVVATRASVDYNIDTNGKQILDDAYTTFKKSVGKVNVLYNHVQNKNIITNGGFDIDSLGYITNWQFFDSQERAVPYASLNGRPGNSADIDRRGKSMDVFTTDYQLNLDANILYKYITFGFLLMPLEGFELDENGFIKWGLDTLKISVTYDVYGGPGYVVRYYLNEFGYWTSGGMQGNQEVTDFSFTLLNNRMVIEFNQDRNFYVGDEVILKFLRSGSLEEHVVTFNETMSVSGGVTYLQTQVPNSAIGAVPYSLWINDVDSASQMDAKVVKTANYYQDIRLQQDSAKPNDIINFTFQSKGGTGAIKVPNPGNLDLISTSRGKLRMSFKCKSGQRYILDDVWMNIDDNNDLYEITNGTKNSEESYQMGISTSFSGFYLSSYKENYGNAEKFMLMSDYSGGGKRLTELYGRGIMNWRNKARKIYNGTFKADIPYMSLVDIDGVKYVPTGMESNKTNGQCIFQGFEASLNTIEPTVIHKGSNNDNLNK